MQPLGQAAAEAREGSGRIHATCLEAEDGHKGIPVLMVYSGKSLSG